MSAFNRTVWFKHVLLIPKQAKNLYKWTSVNDEWDGTVWGRCLYSAIFETVTPLSRCHYSSDHLMKKHAVIFRGLWGLLESLIFFSHLIVFMIIFVIMTPSYQHTNWDNACNVSQVLVGWPWLCGWQKTQLYHQTYTPFEWENNIIIPLMYCIHDIKDKTPPVFAFPGNNSKLHFTGCVDLLNTKRVNKSNRTKMAAFITNAFEVSLSWS